MKKTVSIISALTVLLCLILSAMPVSAAEIGTEYYLEGIGTDELQHWAFYYSTAPNGDDPTADMIALSVPGRQPVANGNWPFDFEIWAYDEPGWDNGIPNVGADNKALVYYADAQYLYMYSMNKNGTFYRSIAAFTAPEDGTYNIYFGGSVSWSPNSMFASAWLNGEMIEGSDYVFSTTQDDKHMGDVDRIKDYSIDVDLKAGEQLCLVIAVEATENRANVENLTATLIAKPDSDSQDQTDANGNEGGNVNNGNSGSDVPDVTGYIIATAISSIIAVASLAVAVITVVNSKKK